MWALTIDARVANWDGDVEVDGLIVEIRPLDAEGGVIAVDGTLEISLLGWRSGTSGFEQVPVRVGRWTKRLRQDEFGPLGAHFRFPFQSVHPEYHLDWAPHGGVHARLSVPGQGVFEATDAAVRIRPYSAFRDRLQHTTGGRFVPLERTGRGIR